MKPDANECLLHVVGEAMKAEPSLEAVKLDHDRQAISIATLGARNVPEIEEELSERIATLRAERKDACGLLRGEADCGSCKPPKPDETLRFLDVRKEGTTTTISRVSCPTAPVFWQWHNFPWPRFTTRVVHLPEDGDDHFGETRWQLAAAVLCGVFGLMGYFAHGPLSLVGYGAAYVAGGWFPAKEVWESLQKRVLDVHFLMLAVAGGGAAIGAWGEGSMLLFLFSLSGALEHYAMGRTHREISALFKIAPKTATLIEDGREVAIEVESLRPGHRLLVKPGDVFPIDGEIAKGKTAADESNLTGEAIPVEKQMGDAVLGGTMNLWGAVEVVTTRPPAQSALQRIIHLIQEAQKLKAPAQKFTDRFGTGYTYFVLGLAALMFFVWWLLLGRAPYDAFYKAMTLLVVASPCALVLSIPSAILAAIAWAARRGILFRGGAAVEKLAQVTTVAMDKTGTLTTGELQIAEVASFPPGREREILELAVALERLSAHPLARAITLHGKKAGVREVHVDNFESVTGQGLKARLDGREILLGRREWIAGARESKAPALGPGFSEVWVSGGDLIGRILLKDEIRPQARDVVVELRKLGLKMLALTGDRRATGEALKEALALDDVRAELRPEDKVKAITELTGAGEKVAMIGDGVNDAPSLAAAYVGVAMGARGSDAALEQAEVILMHDRLENFLAAYHLSRRARRIIYQNLAISLGTVVTLVAFALAGAIPLTLGVLGHEGSTVIVVANSLRLLFSKK
jgi:Cd2+/Zn2+-exporting ATPase